VLLKTALSNNIHVLTELPVDLLLGNDDLTRWHIHRVSDRMIQNADCTNNLNIKTNRFTISKKDWTATSTHVALAGHIVCIFIITHKMYALMTTHMQVYNTFCLSIALQWHLTDYTIIVHSCVGGRNRV